MTREIFSPKIRIDFRFYMITAYIHLGIIRQGIQIANCGPSLVRAALTR